MRLLAILFQSFESLFQGNLTPNTTPNYENKTDFLFIHHALSAKESARETWKKHVGVVVAVITLPPIILSLLTSMHPVVVAVIVVVWLNAILIVFKIVVIFFARKNSFTPVSKKEIRALRDAELPHYTIFVPLLHEAPVMKQIIRALTALEYPHDKLQILVTFEQCDTETIGAFREENPPSYFEEVILPNCNPKSKPKALNVALLQATGDYFVIYDAEIIPDKDQLKHAVIAFQKRPDIAAFQTRLEHYNASESALTRLFNMEFATYYDMFLPGLQYLGFPIPLSGHSVHLRASAARNVGGWDPYNMAEDCDLGIRLFRHGYRTGMIDSLSREEAVGGIVQWIKQRTRWMKGFIQSSIVHLRHPRRFVQEVGGLTNALAFVFLVPGTVFFNIVNFFSWLLLAVWLIFHPAFIKELYPGPVLGIAVLTFVLGTIMFVYLGLVASYLRGQYGFVKYGLLTPFYWILLAVATLRAMVQFVTAPHMWEKTAHGAAKPYLRISKTRNVEIAAVPALNKV